MQVKDLVKKLQIEMNAQGESLVVDGDLGPKTSSALDKFDVAVILSKKPVQIPVLDGSMKTPIQWARGELGQKEISGSQDNPRIRWYHSHTSMGSSPDEVPWCSSFLNACADECGMQKTNKATAISWKTYGLDAGDDVAEGDIVLLKPMAPGGTGHVTLANKAFKRSRDKSFEGIGGNQANSVNVKTFNTADIVACRKWVRAVKATSELITTGQDPDEGTEPWYRRMFNACLIDPGKESMVANAMAKIEAGIPRYFEVAKRLSAKDPDNFCFILGVVHWKEASCDFRGVLHNGEKIIGTGKKTSIVPKGRGPFNSWEDAAVDAISGESSRWKTLLYGSTDIGDILYALERYNGTGYIKGAGKSENSPYLWACSNINDDKGKYVSDGKFDPNASTQETPGAALLLKEFFKAGKFKVTV